MTTPTLLERRKCVVDLLSYIVLCQTAFANALALPSFTVLSAVMTYGMKLENAVFRFRKAQPAYVYGLAALSLRKFVHFLIEPAAFPRYHEWLSRVRTMLTSCDITGTVTCASMLAAFGGAERCLAATTGADAKPIRKELGRPAAAKAKGKDGTTAAKAPRRPRVTPDSRLDEVAAELVARLGVKASVDAFSNVANEIMEKTNDARAKQIKSTTALSGLVGSIRRKLSKAAAGRNINEDAQLVGPIAVASSEAAARPFLDTESRLVIVLDDMTLRKGRESEVKMDAAPLLMRTVVTLATVIERLQQNDAGSRDYAVAVVDALLKVFAGAGPSEAEANATMAQLDASAFGQRATYHKKHEGALRALGFLQGGDAPQPASGPAPYPPAPYPYPPAPAPYPYPPAPGHPYPNGPYPQQQPPMQHVRIHDDPYMKAAVGLSAGAQCCACCALWDM